jgi:hypothetical protein
VLRRILATGLVSLLLLTVLSLDVFSVRGRAQQKKIPRQPVQFVDAVTGKPIPEVYRAGTPFILKLPKSRGLLLGPFAFIGKGRSLWGVLVFARGYRPQWFINLWADDRKLQLTPVSGDDEAVLIGELLSPLGQGVPHTRDECSFWQLPAECKLEIHFDKKERELVRSFLQQSGGGTK